MNSIVLSGKLCRGGELKIGSNNKPFYRGSVACWDSWKKETEFFDFVIFGKQADLFSQWATPGSSLVEIQGKLDVNKWEDKSGVMRTGYTVKVAEFNLVKEPKKEVNEDDGRPDNKDFPEAPRSQEGGPEEDEELPF